MKTKTDNEMEAGPEGVHRDCNVGACLARL